MPLKKPKGPRVLLGPPPQDPKIIFELPGYQNPMVGKRIFELSPIKKNWSDHTRRFTAIFKLRGWQP